MTHSQEAQEDFSSPEHSDRFWGTTRLLHNVYYMFFPLQWSSRDVKPATRLHVKPRLRMSAAVPLLLLSAFMAWTGATSLLPLLCQNYKV